MNFVGLSEREEKRDEIIHLFAHLDQQIKNNQQIVIFGKRFKIDFFFGADMKMICIVFGLYGPKSVWPCFVCHANIRNDYACDLNKMRSSDLQERYCKCRTEHKGYKELSLLPSIPFQRVIIDPLHQKLRVVGRLINLLVREFCELDGLETGLFEIGKHINLTNWLKFLNEKCKLNRKIITCNTDSEPIVTRGFNSNELDKIMQMIDLETDFPHLELKGKKQKLFRDYYLLTSTMKDRDADQVEALTREWHSLFKSVYPPYETPYIHLFGRHMHHFVREVGDISLFTQQGN